MPVPTRPVPSAASLAIAAVLAHRGAGRRAADQPRRVIALQPATPRSGSTWSTYVLPQALLDTALLLAGVAILTSIVGIGSGLAGHRL